MSEPKHAVVIGAGVVGMCIATYLQRDGLKVTVVDMGGPGEGASLGNAGCLNGSSVVPVSSPGVLWQVPRWLMDPLGPLAIRWRYLPALAPWLWRFVRAGRPEAIQAQATALRTLLEPSVDGYRELARDAGVPEIVHQVGHLFVYKTDVTWAKDAGAMALRERHGIAVDELGFDELRQLEPALSREYVRGRLIRENGHLGDPLRLVRALAEAFARRGGEIRRARVTGFALAGGRVVEARTAEGPIPGDVFVLAAGAWSRPLARALGDDVPLDTERGYHVMIRDPEAAPRIPTMSAEGKFVATPMEHGLRLAGTVEFGGIDAPPDWRRADILLALGRRMYPGLAPSHPEERLSRWMGFRPSMPDSLPVIGRTRRHANAFHAFGHGHVGLASGAATGRLVADLVAGRPPGIDPAPFRVERFY